MKNNEVEIMTRCIIEQNNGRALFTFNEARKIVGVGENAPLPNMLHDAGIMVTMMGSRRKVSAYNLALFMTINRIAPIDNTSRPQAADGKGA